MLFTLRWSLSVRAWLGVPLLFTAAVVGLTALGGLLLDATWRVTLSSALLGGAAAVTAALAGAVAWRSPTQRLVLALPFPVLLVAAGVLLDGTPLPDPIAVGAGLPAVALLVMWCVRGRAR